MRRPILYCVLLLLSSCKIFSQDGSGTTLSIHQIPDQGLVLDKGWVFHSGDNPQWADPSFNDRDWTTITPADELHHLPQVQQAEMGWFRLKMNVDSALFNKTVA